MSAKEPTVGRALDGLDMDRSLGKKEYNAELPRYQARLNQLYRVALEQKRSTLMVFEGWDAGGKGGAIRRVTAALDARDYTIVSTGAPSTEERAQHYLWRFWRKIPRAGQVAIFDRSWYGRVLVERVEGFATEAEWTRAYAEINDFEGQLIEHGIVVVKFWLHITPEEQEARFEARRATPHKRWKLTDEDWRNRSRWEGYEAAVEDMVARTSTEESPWHLVPGNDKRHARVEVLRTLCERLELALQPRLPG